MKLSTKFTNLHRALKIVVILPPTILALVAMVAFAGEYMPATRKRVGEVDAQVVRVQARVDTVQEDVLITHDYMHEALAQQSQMLCLMEDREPGRAERCLRVYQQKKAELVRGEGR